MDFYCRDESYNLTDITSDYSDYNLYVSISKTDVLIWTNLCIGLPLTLVTIYALYSLVQKDHVTPIYVINLLISDLIQLCCMIIQVIQPTDWTPCETYYYIYFFGLLSSVGFMVCVAMERYLVVAWPLWYHFRRTIKSSVVVWVLPLVCVLPVYFLVDFQVRQTVFAIFLLLPLPLFIFFLGGTLRALSASQSVPSDEKRRIVGCLVLVILIYTLLFLPSIILFLAHRWIDDLYFVSVMLLRFSPLADLGLYVFMKKGAIDKLLASVCRCKMDSNEISS